MWEPCATVQCRLMCCAAFPARARPGCQHTSGWPGLCSELGSLVQSCGWPSNVLVATMRVSCHAPDARRQKDAAAGGEIRIRSSGGDPVLAEQGVVVAHHPPPGPPGLYGCCGKCTRVVCARRVRSLAAMQGDMVGCGDGRGRVTVSLKVGVGVVGVVIQRPAVVFHWAV